MKRVLIHSFAICFLFVHGYSFSIQAQDHSDFITQYPFSPGARPFIKTLDADFKIGRAFRAITQDTLGIMYFGNNNFGIRQFDGVNWTELSPPNRSTAYGLAIDESGTIYAGFRGEFGYLAPDSLQSLQFKSLQIGRAHV